MMKVDRLQCSRKLRVLARRLDGTKNNPYHTTKELFGICTNENLLDDLRNIVGMFQCKTCNIWCFQSEESSLSNVCEWCEESHLQEPQK